MIFLAVPRIMRVTHENQGQAGMEQSPPEMTTETPQDRFQALFEQHQKIVFKVASTYCRNAEDRRDLAQEITAQLWRAFPRYDPGRAFTTWMYRIALNVAISFARKAGRRVIQAVSLDQNAAEPIGETAGARELEKQMATLRQVIDRLDDLSRALLILYMEEHSYREIADVLGISETNVATKISRLKQRIRKEVGPSKPE